MTPATALDYLKMTNTEFWDFKEVVDLVKKERNCNNTAAYAYLNSLLKTKFSNYKSKNWIENWNILVKDNERAKQSESPPPNDKLRVILKAHKQTNYIATNQTVNQVPMQPETQQQQQNEQGSQFQPQLQDENENYVSDEDETRIPSDLSIDHHPRRTNDYSLSFQEGSTVLEEDTLKKDSINDSKWIINNQCISDLCFGLKKATMQITKQFNSAQLSDSRLLVLNDIYLFDKTPALSVSKNFTLAIHDTIKSTLSFEAYFPPRGIQCYDWCMNIEASPPSDWLSSLKLCGKMITDACESNNLLDIHTAQVLTHVLPIFINGPPDNSIEDSYVHNYLSPLLTTVFGSDSLLHMKWANGQLENKDSKAYKPDFLVYNLSGSVKHVVVISEFKAADQNSYVESDLVKLAKQMRFTMNELVSSGVVEPKVCGIHCEGNNLHTYIMDLISPKVYRMINVAKLKLFGNLTQITCLPSILTHLMCLKNIAHESALKIETAVVSTCANLKRPAPCPPLNWLSNDSVVLSRATKKQKK